MIGILDNFFGIFPWAEIGTLLAGIVVVYLRNVLKKLSIVHKQVTSNGGSSISDAVDRIEWKLGELLAISEILQQISNKPLFRTNNQGDYSWVNMAYMERFDVGLEDVRGSGWLDMIPENERESVARVWRASIKDKRKFEDIFCVKSEEDNCFMKIRCKAYPIIVKEELRGYLGSWAVVAEKEQSHEVKSQ